MLYEVITKNKMVKWVGSKQKSTFKYIKYKIMKKIIIWVDMDEVLAELMDYVLEYNDYKVWNKILNREDITEYNVYNIEWVGLSFEEAIDYFKFAILSDKEIV